MPKNTPGSAEPTIRTLRAIAAKGEPNIQLNGQKHQEKAKRQDGNRDQHQRQEMHGVTGNSAPDSKCQVLQKDAKCNRERSYGDKQEQGEPYGVPDEIAYLRGPPQIRACSQVPGQRVRDVVEVLEVDRIIQMEPLYLLVPEFEGPPPHNEYLMGIPEEDVE